MTINPPDNAAKTYLQAIGAAAIYVAIDHGNPVSVGVARDLDKALGNLQRIMSPTTEFGWVAWSPQYNALIDLSQMPDLLFGAYEGVKVALPLEAIVRRIDITARETGIALTQHSLVIERASTYSKHVDDAMTAMQKAGVLKQFNQAYRKHRLELARKGESAPPYWAVLGDLRAIIVRALVAQGKTSFAPDLALAEMHKAFPWFSRWHKNGRSTRLASPIDKVLKMK